jgi:hypothetical protein
MQRGPLGARAWKRHCRKMHRMLDAQQGVSTQINITGHQACMLAVGVFRKCDNPGS